MLSKVRRFLFASAAFCAFMSPASAAGVLSSPISKILLWENGNLIYVYPQYAVQGTPPACSTAGYFTISMARPMAKEYLALLLAAQARGAVVTIWGTGTCADQSFAEKLDYLRIESD